MGGYARIKAAIDASRSQMPTIVLDAGDEFVGTLFSSQYKGNESWPFLNAIGVHAMVST